MTVRDAYTPRDTTPGHPLPSLQKVREARDIYGSLADTMLDQHRPELDSLLDLVNLELTLCETQSADEWDEAATALIAAYERGSSLLSAIASNILLHVRP